MTRPLRTTRREWIQFGLLSGVGWSLGCGGGTENPFGPAPGGAGQGGLGGGAPGGNGGTPAGAGAAPDGGRGGAAGSASGGTFTGGGTAGASSGGTAGQPSTCVPTADPFGAPLPIPPELEPVSTDGTTDTYELTMRAGTAQLRSGTPTQIWGYNGIWPGPTIRARRGRTVRLRVDNQLPDRMSLHLHGANTPPEHDGHPADTFQPGTSREYVFPNEMPAAPLWYHDHAVDQTGAHVVKGLAGFYLLTDDEEEALGLPSGPFDVPLVIQDRTLDADNQLVYALDRDTIDVGFLGDLYCVNGALTPHFAVANVKYRFRVLNGSNARTYTLRLDNGASFWVIGSDGGLLPAPVEVTRLEIGSAERFDIVIDFSSVPLCSSVVLEDAADDGSDFGRGGSFGGDWWTGGSGGSTSGTSGGRPVMRFDVVREGVDDSALPQTLRPLSRMQAGEALTTRRFVLDQDNDSWVINGLGFDAARIDARPILDTVEIWEFDNSSSEMHPMHVHLVQFQILDIDGQPPPPELAGWKDTVRVDRRGRVRVIARFSDHTGVYVFHCHKLEHEDHHMMAQFEVVPA